MAKYKDQEFLNKIGKRIEEIRISKNLTHEKMAERMGLDDVRQVGRIVRAETNFSSSELSRFAYVLGVHPRELLDFDFDITEKYIPPFQK